MSKKNIWLFGLLASLSLSVFSSCDDDDDSDSNKLNYSDPRVRTMSIAGIERTFIINDVEESIYNYDSLSFGTNIKALHPEFNGYQVKTNIFYDSAGVWKTYPKDTSFKLDFSQKVKIRSLSVDSTQFKDYTINLRVHKYDVEAFEWLAISDNATVISETGNEKSVFANGMYHLFVTNGENTSYLTSKDGATWELISTETYEATPDWRTLTVFNDKFYVEMGNDLYESNCDQKFASSSLQTPSGFVSSKPIFTLGNRLWFIAQAEDKTNALCFASTTDSALTISRTIAEKISYENLTATVSASGNSNLGYIFSQAQDSSCIILSVDKSGFIINPCQGTTFPYHEGMTIFSYEKLLCVMGGKNANGEFINETYSSNDSGLSWKKNPHRIMPGNGQFVNSQVFIDQAKNSILLVGGNHGDNGKFAWKGILKQFIIDDILYGTNTQF